MAICKSYFNEDIEKVFRIDTLVSQEGDVELVSLTYEVRTGYRPTYFLFPVVWEALKAELLKQAVPGAKENLLIYQNRKCRYARELFTGLDITRLVGLEVEKEFGRIVKCTGIFQKGDGSEFPTTLTAEEWRSAKNELLENGVTGIEPYMFGDFL